jgi:hypothetical protein
MARQQHAFLLGYTREVMAGLKEQGRGTFHCVDLLAQLSTGAGCSRAYLLSVCPAQRTVTASMACVDIDACLQVCCSVFPFEWARALLPRSWGPSTSFVLACCSSGSVSHSHQPFKTNKPLAPHLAWGHQTTLTLNPTPTNSLPSQTPNPQRLQAGAAWGFWTPGQHVTFIRHWKMSLLLLLHGCVRFLQA